MKGVTEVLFETEEERWRDVDCLDSWELHRYETPDALRGGGWDIDEGYNSVFEEQTARKGEIGGEWQYRLLPLAARFSLDYLREFDDPLPAIGDESEESRYSD